MVNVTIVSRRDNYISITIDSNERILLPSKIEMWEDEGRYFILHGVEVPKSVYMDLKIQKEQMIARILSHQEEFTAA